MTKREFMTELQRRLSGLPEAEREERLGFLSEMIDDRIEEGATEEEAIRDIGSVEEIAEQIIGEVPLAKIARERIRPKRKMRAWEIVLLILGSPIWLSLAIAALAVILAVYVVLWSVDASLWAVFAALAVCAVGGVAGGILLIVFGNVFFGIGLIGAGIVCAGLSIFFFFGCLAATKGLAWLTKRIALGIKKIFVGKEKVS